ncbi:MAG TPA: ABC transporter permease [Acidothermaceae bacterium]|nr:ABC transporter permease [Acidothermaceae bacterium]
MNAVYLRYELLRTLRNRRFFIFTLAFPLVFFYLIAGANRHQELGGIPFATYYLAGMASFGTMMAMISAGGRIASERQAGWNRQLRLTPLTPREYFRAKVATGYMMALITLMLLFVAGLTLGVHLQVREVASMVGLVAVGLIPFAALGIFVGHMFTPDSIGPVLGGGVSILAFLGGAWGPIGGTHGFMHDVSLATPTYWLVQAGHTLVGQQAWDSTGWLVVGSWTAVLAVLAARAYQRDTKRV